MTELKKLGPKLSPPPNKLKFADGFFFGLGFWAAGFIILPLLSCGAFVMLLMLGISLGDTFSRGN